MELHEAAAMAMHDRMMICDGFMVVLCFSGVRVSWGRGDFGVAGGYGPGGGVLHPAVA